jgi:hypothetical protein
LKTVLAVEQPLAYVATDSGEDWGIGCGSAKLDDHPASFLLEAASDLTGPLLAGILEGTLAAEERVAGNDFDRTE